MNSRVLLSGVQPTGSMHIGNYLGFLRHFVKLQEEAQFGRQIITIADLHSISTGFRRPAELKKEICHTLAILLSAGLDPHKTLVVQQSRVPAHSELMWILGAATTLPSLTELGQYKDKSRKLKAIPIGLVTYPLLQAADVLAYRSTHVLVGSDQKQHLDLLREIAHSFNKKVGMDYFPIPDRVLTTSPKIKSLREATAKMSKSCAQEKSRINLTDSKEVIIAKLKGALSDSSSAEISFDPERRPAISNLVTLYSAFTGMDVEQIVEEHRGLDTLAFKLQLASVIEEHLAPIREKYHELLKDEPILWSILEEGGRRACEIAAKTMDDVRTIVGFR